MCLAEALGEAGPASARCTMPSGEREGESMWGPATANPLGRPEACHCYTPRSTVCHINFANKSLP